jgi:hypothetical protein
VAVARNAVARSEVQRRDERELRWYFGEGRAVASASSVLAQRRADARAHRIASVLERLSPSVVRLLGAAYGRAHDDAPLAMGRVFGITAGAASASVMVAALGGVEAYVALANRARSVAASRGGTALRAIAFVTTRTAIEDEVRRALTAYRHAGNVVRGMETRAHARERLRRTGRLPSRRRGEPDVTPE